MSMRNSVEGRSACGLPLRDGVRIVIMDLNTYPDYQAHRAIAASRGYRGVSIDASLDRNIGKSVGVRYFREPNPGFKRVALERPLRPTSCGHDHLPPGEQRLRESEVRASS